MIHYELKCANGHAFEGWFRSSDAYEQQARDGELSCPICQDHAVERAPMAPNLARRTGSEAPAPVKHIQMLRALRRFVEANSENVGARFAEEARKIHEGESDARPIYGDATPDETKALSEDGIDFAQIPWVPTSDA